MLGFVIMDPSTEAALLKLGTWTPLLGVLGILAVQGLCSVAIIRFFLTEARDGFHPIKTLIAPILGALAMAGACYLLIANRGVLSGAGDSVFIKLIPFVVLAIFVAGMVLALTCGPSTARRTRKWDASRERRFPHEHVDAPPVLHPLEPLAAEEVGRQFDPEGGEGARRRPRASSSSACTSRQGRRPGGRAGLARGVRRPLREAERKTYEAVVSLTDRSVVSFEHIEGVQPPITAEEFMACEELVQSDPQWQAAMRLRGVEDFSLAMVDPWAAGSRAAGQPGRAPDRAAADVDALRAGRARLRAADRRPRGDRRPGLDDGRRRRRPRRRRLPPAPGNYDPERMTAPENVPSFPAARTDLKPTRSRSPRARRSPSPATTSAGRSGVRVGFTPREGLVLHELSYDERPIIYRASLAEMFVPYGDPAPTHRYKNVFDQGEYGVGWLANSLTLGCDCVGEITTSTAWSTTRTASR